MARSVRLSVDEAWAVVEGSHTGVFTTLRRDGVPIALPVWFVAIDRRIYVSGPDRTKKFTRLRNDARASFLVESGEHWAELVGVHFTGTARFLEPCPLLDRVAAALHDKYEGFRVERSDMPDATAQHYATATTTVEFTADDRFVSWDNARLFD